jgi:hypothetical protein
MLFCAVLCFHTLTNCLFSKPIVLITMQQGDRAPHPKLPLSQPLAPHEVTKYLFGLGPFPRVVFLGDRARLMPQFQPEQALL